MTGHEMFLLFVCIWGGSMSIVGLISLVVAKWRASKTKGPVCVGCKGLLGTVKYGDYCSLRCLNELAERRELKWIEIRLQDMERCPMMWAVTVDGFVGQLGVLMEFLGFSHNKAYKPLIKGPTYAGLTNPITNEIARKLIVNFREITGIYETTNKGKT